MSRSYWRVIFAVVGFLSLTSATDHRDNKGHQAKQEVSAKQPLAPSQTVEPTKHTDQPDTAQQQCVGYDGTKADCNVVAVQAAVQQARDADIQANTALVGMAIGFATFIAAGFAAIYARSAYLSYRITDRAWVVFKSLDIMTHTGPDGLINGVVIQVVFSNAGNSPAVKAGASMHFRTFPSDSDPEKWEFDPIAPRDYSLMSVGPNMPIQTSGLVSSENLRRLYAKKERAAVLAQVSYYDFYMRKWRYTEAAFELELHTPPDLFIDKKPDEAPRPLLTGKSVAAQRNGAT